LLTTIYRDNRRLLHVIWNDISKQKKRRAGTGRLPLGAQARVAERTAALAATAESLRVANVERQAIFDATTVGIVFVQDRKILRCNRAVEELFGYSRSQLEHESMRLLYSGEVDFDSMGAHSTLTSMTMRPSVWRWK
jgi:two-component system sensor histidine kinase/response regulator